MLFHSSRVNTESSTAFDHPTPAALEIPIPVLAGGRPRLDQGPDWSAKSNDAFSDRSPHRNLGPWLDISLPKVVTRRAITWDGMAAEVVETTTEDQIEYRLKGRVHLLAVCEKGQRRTGETFVEGLPRSAVRSLTGKITVVPAGREYHERHEPHGFTRTIFVYLDPAKTPALDPLSPRLHFQDALLHALALRLRKVVEAEPHSDRTYLQALGVVIANEVQRLDRAPSNQPELRGGLAAWQERKIAAYVEEHVAEQISLAQFAQLARLSPFHFARAFK